MEHVKTIFGLGAQLPVVYQFFDEESVQNSELRNSISRLEAKLINASQLIERSECWCFRYDNIQKLLSYLKNAVYEAELTIEEFKSQRRRAENTDWNNTAGELIENFKNWVTGFKEKVISAQCNLDYFCDQLEKICDSHEIPQNPEKFSRPMTKSHPRDELFGRGNELKDAISMLGFPKSGKSSSCTEGKRKIPVLPIVGMGGIGKTMLCQHIYKHQRVKYDKTIWICVTKSFDSERILKEMIECVTDRNCKFINETLIEDKLIEAIKPLKVLLVLDDIWSTEWQQLLEPMNKALEGSAIILTTRFREYFINGTEGKMTLLEPISLEGLEVEPYFKFFKKCAGLSVNLRNYSELEDIAREICSRLKGSPLAAKTLGGALSERTDIQHWITIRDSKMWKVKQGENGIMHVLYLSYMHLPSVELKNCFSYCSMFPKHHLFRPKELVRFWIMNSFIPIQENLKSMENLALGYFRELENRGFFYRIKSNFEERYVMHDLMHDVCQSLKGDECYCLEDEAFANIPPNMHRMSVCHTKLLNEENLKKLDQSEKVHTLLVVPDNYGIGDISRGFLIAFEILCNKLKNIRRLSLPRCDIKEIPDNIGNYKYLQYLDISNNPELKKLPQSFCNLYNLEFLDMHDCFGFGTDGFEGCCDKLRGLKYFIPPDHVVNSLKHIPMLFEAMQLYDLTYKVENDGENKIENLKLLKGVYGFLNIEGLEKVSSKVAAEEAGLNKQELLEKLSLYWDEFRSSTLANNEVHMEVLDGLCPHSNLEVLEIHYYNGSDIRPRWMRNNDLPKLKRVMFHSCWNKTVSQLPCSITEINIHWCKELESLVDCLQPNLLPKLKCIEIEWCSKLKSLPVDSFREFMSLEKLRIWGCFSLTCPVKMSLPPSIKYLELNDCGELDKSIPSCLQNLTSLEVLFIWKCSNIVSIPNEVMENIPSLRRLDVEDCENLESLGDEEFLQSKTSLYIIVLSVR